MKILFIGSVELSLKVLEEVIYLGGNVVGVCTLKSSPFNNDFCDLSKISNKYEIPWRYAGDINSEKTVKWISNLEPDVIFCFGWSRLLKEEILSIPPKGVVGFHPAALPANRGRHPIIWALVLGLTETASTFFFMDDGIDSGDILSQKPILISDDDDARSLYDKIVSTAIEQVKEFIPTLENGSYKKVKQESGAENFWRKRDERDGIIDWRMNALSIHNTVRGLFKPYVGAKFLHRGAEYTVWKTELVPCHSTNIEPGKVINVSSADIPTIKCGMNAIKLVKVEPDISLMNGTYL